MAAEVGLNWLFDLQGEKKKEGIKIQEENRSTFSLKEIINENQEPFRKLTLKGFLSGNALKAPKGPKATSFVRTEGELYFSHYSRKMKISSH